MINSQPTQALGPLEFDKQDENSDPNMIINMTATGIQDMKLSDAHKSQIDITSMLNPEESPILQNENIDEQTQALA